MKAIKKRPSQRPLLVVLSMTIFTGCSGIQPKAVYKNLEQGVQHVYEAAAPIHKEGLVPALFRTVSSPGLNALKSPRVFRAKHQSEILVSTELKPKSVKQRSKLLKNVEHVKHIDSLKHVEHIKHIKPPKFVKPKTKDHKKTERTTPIKNLQYIEKYYGL